MDKMYRKWAAGENVESVGMFELINSLGDIVNDVVLVERQMVERRDARNF